MQNQNSSSNNRRAHSKRAVLNERESYARERALSLLSDLRRDAGSYSNLLRKHALDTRTARRHLGRDLLGGKRGEPVRASKADRRVRDVFFPTPVGDLPFRTRNSRDATKLSDFFNDRYKLLTRKMSAGDFEAKWRGVQVAGKELFADASEIWDMYNAGELTAKDLYANMSDPR